MYDSKRWRVLRRRKLFIDPLCERCGVVGRDVHHRVDLSDGGDPFAVTNLESLCRSCDSKETWRRKPVWGW